jgi:gluconokinase
MLTLQNLRELFLLSLSVRRYIMSTVFDEAVLEERPEIDLSVLPSFRAEREDTVVLAMDIGSSGARAALFDSRGEQIHGSLVARPSQSYAAFISGADVDADSLVESIAAALDLAVEFGEVSVSHIDYVALACFWHSLVGVDDAGNAITPLLGWADLRAAAEAGELSARFDESQTHGRTGCRFHPSYWPAKLLWLRKTDGAAFGRVRCWLSFSDYLFLNLFGEPATSVSMASATGLLDQTTCDWDDELLTALSIERDQLPSIPPARATFRGLRDKYLLRWPMLDRAAWFPAIGDGAANNIGLGCVSTERIALMLGASGAMRMLSSRVAPAVLPSQLFCYRADRERVVIGGALSDGGSLLAWMKDTQALNYDEAEFNQLLTEVEPDSHGLTILPSWTGERAPGWSPSARGIINGLTARTKPVDIVHAAMESVCYSFALIRRELDTFASKAAITLTGKMFLSNPAWAQMMADVLGNQIELSTVPEVTIRGAALLALETIGTIDSLETIKTEVGRVFLPDMKRHEVYARAINRQQELYEKLISH